MNQLFNPNYQKYQEALKYLKIKNPTETNLINILFKAEIEHLNLYGRPITGVNYIKLSKGVNSLVKVTNSSQKLNLDVFSLSDLEILDKNLNELDLSSFKEQEVIDYKRLVTNPEVIADLSEIEPFSIVI